MREDNDIFDDVDWRHTIEREVCERGAPIVYAQLMYFAEKRLYELDPIVSPGLFLLYLHALKAALKKAQSALPNRIYREAKKHLDSGAALLEKKGMQIVARRILSTRREELHAQLLEEMTTFWEAGEFKDDKPTD